MVTGQVGRAHPVELLLLLISLLRLSRKERPQNYNGVRQGLRSRNAPRMVGVSMALSVIQSKSPKYASREPALLPQLNRLGGAIRELLRINGQLSARLAAAISALGLRPLFVSAAIPQLAD